MFDHLLISWYIDKPMPQIQHKDIQTIKDYKDKKVFVFGHYMYENEKRIGYRIICAYSVSLRSAFFVLRNFTSMQTHTITPVTKPKISILLMGLINASKSPF